MRRIAYDREFLMSLRSTALSKNKPEGLPNLSDILLNKPNTGGDIFREGMRNNMNPSFFKPLNVSVRAVARHCLLQVVERFCSKLIWYANLIFCYILMARLLCSCRYRPAMELSPYQWWALWGLSVSWYSKPFYFLFKMCSSRCNLNSAFVLWV